MSVPAIFGIVAALGVISLVLWLKTPWIGLLAWVAALSIQYELFPEVRLAISDLLVPSLALTLLFTTTKIKNKTRQARSSLPVLMLTFAAVFIILGGAVAYYNLGTIPQWTWLNKDLGLLDLLICFFAIIRLVDSRGKLYTIVRTFVLSGSALNILALAGGVARYFFGIPNVMIYNTDSIRLAGLMVNPSAYGGFILCVLLIQLALLFGESTLLRLPRWAQRTNAALLGIACSMTISRSSLLGLIGGLLVLLAFYRTKAMLRLVGFALATVLTVGVVTYWYGYSPDVADDFWVLVFSETTIEDRMDINRAALEMLRESPTNPITGIGVGTFWARSEHEFGMEMIIHNEFLWLLVETGVVGFCLFIGVILRALRNCLYVVRARGPDSPISVGIICSIVGMIVWMQGGEGLGQRHFWLLLALSEVSYGFQRKARLAAVFSRLPRLCQQPQVTNPHGNVQAG
ncbi:MAG TPA: O-antigen ligase family protein [Candidatus Acidoferrales bacterium]|nr:O-antigen ligase family protein [Candidatus Acidoferrales bacterium]